MRFNGFQSIFVSRLGLELGLGLDRVEVRVRITIYSTCDNNDKFIDLILGFKGAHSKASSYLG
jgi:hypothetical protein